MKLKTDEKGFTLVELLVALSIATFVTAAASMTIITMMRLSPQTNNWAIALHQVQNAGYWISRDVQMSQQKSIIVGTGTPTDPFLKFTIPTGPTTSKTVDYQFEDMSDGLKRLMRNDSGQKTMIAEYIYYDPLGDPDNSTRVTTTPQKENGWVLTVRIAATSGNVPVTKTYEATQRVPAATP